MLYPYTNVSKYKYTDYVEIRLAPSKFIKNTKLMKLGEVKQ